MTAALETELANIPGELRQRPQWVGFRLAQQQSAKPTKRPVDPKTSRLASVTDASTWGTFTDACGAVASGRANGIGFVFTPDDPYSGVDLDGCRNPVTGELSADAQVIINQLDSYAEVSPSGTGVHIIVRGVLPPGRRRRGRVEVYDRDRFFTMTGQALPESPTSIRERTDALAAFHAAHVADPRPASPPPPAPAPSPRADDQQILEQAFAAANGPKLRALYDGDTSGYTSNSEADQAFCSRLAFYTQVPEQIDRLFRMSGLVRAKWIEREDYRQRTIAKALEGLTATYTPPMRLRASPPATPSAPPPADVLPFRTAQEVSSANPVEPEWILEGVLAVSAITELAAKVKVGKTTLVAHWINAIREGKPFLGRRTRPTGVLVLTEETDPAIQAELIRAGLTDAADVHYLRRVDVPDLAWPDIVDRAIVYGTDHGARVLIVDTLGPWSGVRGDEENSSGAALEAMIPLQKAAAAGFAVLVIRHARKSGGDLGDSARGSSAISGAVDIVLQHRRANTQGHPNRRELVGVGRLPGVPEQLVIELTNQGYELVGDVLEAERLEAKEAILSGLPLAGEGVLSEAEIIDQTGATRTTVRRALAELVTAELVDRKQCTGKTRRAYGYWLVNGVTSPRTPGHTHYDAETADPPANDVTPLRMTPGHNHYPQTHVSEIDVTVDPSSAVAEPDDAAEMPGTSPLPLSGQSIAAPDVADWEEEL